MTQRCVVCGEMKPFEDFHRNKGRKSGYDNRCKACEKVRTEQRTARWRDENNQIVADALAEGCAHCGIKITTVLQFHHVEPLGNQLVKTKTRRIGDYRRERSPNTLRREIAKCLVLCACCHLLVHAERG